MGWEIRNGKRYFYTKRREGERVISIYWGNDWYAKSLADDAEERQFVKTTEAEVERANHGVERDFDRELEDELAFGVALINAVLRSSGFHKHKGQWRFPMKKQKLTIKRAQTPRAEIIKLQQRMSREKVPDPKDVARFRALAISNPSLWSYAASSISRGVREYMVNLMTDGKSRAMLLSELDILKRQLGQEGATPLELILIEHILTARARLYWAEQGFTQRACEGNNFYEVSGRWNQLLDSAHGRFLRAVEMLARVRRLASKSPILQLNIANEGGRQIIVGDMDNPSPPSPAFQQLRLF